MPIWAFHNSWDIMHDVFDWQNAVTANFIHYNNAYDFDNDISNFGNITWQPLFIFDNDISSNNFGTVFTENGQVNRLILP